MASIKRVFLDTSYFKAWIDDKDEFHDRALNLLEQLERESEIELLTSNFVIDETFTLLRVKSGVEVAQKFYKFLEGKGSEIDLVRVTAGDERKVWNWFWKKWSKLSFTDCTSFAIMKRLELKQVATFDEHFAKAGFEVIAG